MTVKTTAYNADQSHKDFPPYLLLSWLKASLTLPSSSRPRRSRDCSTGAHSVQNTPASIGDENYNAGGDTFKYGVSQGACLCGKESS